MTKPTALTIAAAGLGAASLLAGCSSSSDTTTTTAAPATTTTAPATTTAKPATTAAGAAATLPAAPSGSIELQNTTTNGVVYQRWSNASGATPQQIVADYQTALAAEGYAITNSGGGGGGWGKWGGASAGLTGNKGTTYVDVQAGGQTGQPVFFEVCQGANQRAVDDCENVSEGPQQNQNNDSNSNAS